MAEYKSKLIDLPQSANEIYDKLTDLRKLDKIIKDIPADQIPDDKRALINGIYVKTDSITIPGGPTGDITLVKGECVEPSKVIYNAQGTPVPVSITADIFATGADSCQVEVVASLIIPAMLKPMVNGPMQKMIDQVAMTLTQLAKH